MDTAHNTVYIETSIPSFYYTLRTDPESVARMNWTRRWWQEYADQGRALPGSDLNGINILLTSGRATFKRCCRSIACEK